MYSKFTFLKSKLILYHIMKLSFFPSKVTPFLWEVRHTQIYLLNRYLWNFNNNWRLTWKVLTTHINLKESPVCNIWFLLLTYITNAGADPGFQVRGCALKKIAPSGGRRENFWGISCEKSRFYAKKSFFFQLWGGGGRPPLNPPL